MNIGLNQTEIKEIIKAVIQFPEIEKTVVFGSRAKGNFKKGSDVDLSVQGKNITYKTIVKLSEKLNSETTLPYFFDIVHYKNINNKELKNHIDRVGKIIFENLKKL